MEFVSDLRQVSDIRPANNGLHPTALDAVAQRRG